MVVASLTATTAFQVGANPPGGSDYVPILGVNSASFIASLSIIMLLVSGLPLRRRFFILVLMVIMWIAIAPTTLTYSFSVLASMREWILRVEIIKVGIFVWMGFMGLIYVGQTIRLALRTNCCVRKIVKRRRSSSSTLERQDSIV